MFSLSTLLHRLEPLHPRCRQERERDVVDELTFHLEMRAADNRDAGQSPRDAWAAAHRQFGNFEVIKQQCLRIQEQHPLRTLVYFAQMALPLAVGLGGLCAMALLVYAILLRPQPYNQDGRILALWLEDTEQGTITSDASIPDFLDWRARNEVFASITMSRYQPLTITGDGPPERILARRVASDYFTVYDTQPLLGRVFRPEEEERNAQPLAVLNYEFWQRRYDGDPTIVGRTLWLNDAPYTVVGVMPPRFQMYHKTDLLLPFPIDPNALSRTKRPCLVVGRLKPGVTRAQAQAHMQALARDLARQYPETNAHVGVRVRSLVDVRTPSSERHVLFVLLGVGGLLLLVVCAGIGRQHRARFADRVRILASGAAYTPRRAVWTGVAENVLLAGGVGLLSLWIAPRLAAVLLDPVVGSKAHLFDLSLDGRLAGAALALALLIGVVVGVAPALSASRGSLKRLVGRRARRRLRRSGFALTVFEVAGALVLLIAAGLTSRSLLQVARIDPGFTPDSVLVAPLMLPTASYPTPRDQAAFFTKVFERIEPLPEVRGASLSLKFPMQDAYGYLSFMKDRDAASAGQGTASVWFNKVGTDYLKIMGVPLVRGRLFAAEDARSSDGVVVINESMAATFWPGENPVGQRLFFPGVARPFEVVGVVGNVRKIGLETPAACGLYLLYWQIGGPSVNLVIRAGADPQRTMAAVQRELYALDENLPLGEAVAAKRLIRRSLQSRILFAVFFGLAALAALALTARSLHRTIAETVREQTREIGLRIALGASPRDVLAFTLKPGLRATLAGTLLGAALAFLCAHTLSDFLFGVTPTDPFTYLAVSFLLILVGLAVGYGPAWRATRIDPLLALRL